MCFQAYFCLSQRAKRTLTLGTELLTLHSLLWHCSLAHSGGGTCASPSPAPATCESPNSPQSFSSCVVREGTIMPILKSKIPGLCFCGCSSLLIQLLTGWWGGNLSLIDETRCDLWLVQGKPCMTSRVPTSQRPRE